MAIQTALDSISNNAGSPYGFKNRIINGGMVIDQRNAGASYTPVHAYHSLDRWQWVISQSSKLTTQQNSGSVTPPPGFTNYMGVVSSSSYSPTTNDYFVIWQKIEGYNFADFDWGKTTAKPVTISFWVRSSLTGNHSAFLRNNDNTRNYPFVYTINQANTWEYKTITISGDQSGTWNTTTGIGLHLGFSMGAGTGTNGTANTWNNSGYFSVSGSVNVVGTNAATWYITGVQVEMGNQATSFDFRDYATEMDLCQRYYYRITRVDTTSGSWDSFAHGQSWSNTASSFTFYLPKIMRSSPSMSTSAGTDFGFHSPGAAYTTTTGVGAYAISTYVIQLNASLASTVGSTVLPGFLTAKSGATAWISFESEL